MSNTFSSSPVLTDPSRVTAGQTIRTTEVSRLCDIQNYIFAVGGCHNVINQTYDDSCFVQDATAFETMSQWYIPVLSRAHNDLVINISGFCATAGAQVVASLKFPVSNNKYTTTINITDTSRYGSTFNTGTITKPSTELEEFAILILSVKAPVGDEVEILGIQANWSPLTSPLSAGVKGIGASRFIPQGSTRQSADRPLTSRFGVETLENINILRKRSRVLLNWSGVSEASSSSAISVAANPPIGLGIGDRYLMFSETALFSGMNETDDLRVHIFICVQDLTSPDTIVVDIFDRRFTLTQNDWSAFSVTLVRDEIERSNEFGLSMYRVGLDVTDVNGDNLLSGNKLIANNPSITALSIIGV